MVAAFDNAAFASLVREQPAGRPSLATRTTLASGRSIPFSISRRWEAEGQQSTAYRPDTTTKIMEPIAHGTSSPWLHANGASCNNTWGNPHTFE